MSAFFAADETFRFCVGTKISGTTCRAFDPRARLGSDSPESATSRVAFLKFLILGCGSPPAQAVGFFPLTTRIFSVTALICAKIS